MIQRIQSVYLLIVLTSLILITIGSDVFVHRVKKEEVFELKAHANVYGVQKDFTITGDISEDDLILIKREVNKTEIENDMEGIPTNRIPFYSITIILSMLTVVVLFGYKNLERQMKLGRLLFVLNLLMFIGTTILYYSFKSTAFNDVAGVDTVTYLEFGFYCIAITVAFSFLANTGIKRDLKLIKSIDRIR